MPAGDPSDLYGLPLERFLPDRAALAKGLRSEGRGEEAKRVAALHKPSVAAWAVNQLVRSQAKALAELFAAGDELRRAQEQLLAGHGDSGELRALAARERELVDRLSATASRLLSGDGRSPSAGTLERVSETLHAAAVEAQAREAVRSGCLERELRHVGLGSDAGAATATGDPSAARRAEREQRKQLASAREAEIQTRRRAAQTARALGAAERRRDRATEKLRHAEEVLLSLRQEVDLARAAHRAAQEALTRAERAEHAARPSQRPR